MLKGSHAYTRPRCDRVLGVGTISDGRGEFLVSLARELCRPLASVQNSLELMRLCPADRLACERAREVASEQIEHLCRLIDDLVEVTGIDNGRIRLCKETVELCQIVNRSVENVRSSIESRCQQLTVSVPREPVWLEADPVRLVQILSHLLKNAVKHTPYGGRVWLSAECDEQDVVLRVRDTGVGMSSDLLPRIFNLFAKGAHGLSGSQDGFGIGLTVVRHLVELHGGSVVGRSEGLGRGTEFVVRLPVLCHTSRRAGQLPETQE